MNINVILDEGAFMPERAHATDAGMDLRSPVDIMIPAQCGAVIDTGVHVELPHECAGMLVSKSGLNVNHGITSTGLIDEGYDGSIRVKLYNHTYRGYMVHRGDKISQLVVLPVEYVGINVVDRFETASERGSNGFGSTGK